MPITLDDDLANLLLRHFLTGTKVPAGTGAAILAAIQDNQKSLLTLQGKIDTMSGTQQSVDQQFQTELAGIQSDMAKQTTVTNSVLVFVSGIKDKLAQAIASAQAAGATPAELAAVQALHADLNTNTSALVGATTENTTAATEAPAPVEPTTTVPQGPVEATTTVPNPDPAAAGVTGGTTATATVDDTGAQQPAV